MKVKLSIMAIVVGAGLTLTGGIKLDTQFFVIVPAILYTAGLSTLWFGVGVLVAGGR